MHATRASCLCLLGALVGCNGLQAEVHSPATVEYTVTDYDRDENIGTLPRFFCWKHRDVTRVSGR